MVRRALLALEIWTPSATKSYSADSLSAPYQLRNQTYDHDPISGFKDRTKLA